MKSQFSDFLRKHGFTAVEAPSGSPALDVVTARIGALEGDLREHLPPAEPKEEEADDGR